MKIGILQLNFTVGDFAGNAAKILHGYRDACAQGAELVVSSELALFGYPPKDMLELAEYLAAQNEALAQLTSGIGDVGLIIGVAEENQDVGKPLFNSAALLQNGEQKIIWRKALLPTYDVFDEQRYFEPGKEAAHSFNYNGYRIAVLICEDIWRNGSETNQGRTLYERDPVRELANDAPKTLLVLNGSPYYWGKGSARYGLVRGIARKLHSAVVYVNQVGGNDDLVFDGRSFALNSSGRCIAALAHFEEAIVVADTFYAHESSYSFDDGNIADLYKALVLGTRDYMRKIGNGEGALVALSGGIDSALVACIAVDALGKDKVLGVSMPSRFSSVGSIVDAIKLANNLGIEMKTVPIKWLYEDVKKALEPAIGWYEPGARKGDTTEENVQARLRGLIAMAFSNRLGRIVLATGNKSEIAMGYCTLYGDMVGGFAVIADVWKTLVCKLAYYRNGVSRDIPENTLVKPPSAELRPDQKDEDSLPPYPILDVILRAYLEESIPVSGIAAYAGATRETVDWVISQLNKMEFKRRQMAPCIKISRHSLGVGRQWPIAAKFLG